MNDTNTNVGGWESSSMRTYVNNTIYNALPSDLKSKILETTVISGHGNTDGESNFTTTDRLYLLSTHEVWVDADGIDSAGTYNHDTAYDNTRQLDYYANNNVTTSNYASTIKNYNGTADQWWLRTASYSLVSDPNYTYNFVRVGSDGALGVTVAHLGYYHGVAPAFRIDSSAESDYSFATDSWDTIVSNISNGHSDVYSVGDTREIELTGYTNGESGSYGLYTIRVANNSTPSECSNANFSQSACGFVIEFVDIIYEDYMKGTDASGSNVTNTEGGWENRNIRTYINDTIYNALPSDLKSKILATTVISGHGNNDGENNFTTTDYLYLLSSHEVWVDDDGDASDGITDHDTAYDNTRQLDYYANNNITIEGNHSGAIKNYNGAANAWWLRTANYGTIKTYFLRVGTDGDWFYTSLSLYKHGIAPAFRIG